jgi:hypothetical protein
VIRQIPSSKTLTYRIEVEECTGNASCLSA